MPCFEICRKKETALIGVILNVHNVFFFYKFVTAFVSDRLLLKRSNDCPFGSNRSLLKSIHQLCFISNKYYFYESSYAMRILLTFLNKRRHRFSAALELALQQNVIKIITRRNAKSSNYGASKLSTNRDENRIRHSVVPLYDITCSKQITCSK